MTAHDVAPPRLAATVMLLRETRRGAEALLVRRHTGIAFMGGVWVFPGGKLEPSDTSDEAMGRLPAEARARCEAWAGGSRRPCSARDASGLYVAACRETFEEAGVLLASHGRGTRFPADEVARLRREQAQVAQRAAAFVEMLQREGLVLDDGLVPWAHWITPSLERIRFDARFFAAGVDAEHEVVVDVTESTDHVWIRPADALSAFERGDIVLAGPTVVTLGEAAAGLREHRTAAAMLEAERARDIMPIVPRLRREGDEVMAYLPWDPEYASIEGEGSPEGIEIPPRLRQFASRRLLPRVEHRVVR